LSDSTKGSSDHHPRPPDWSASDSVLESEIEQEERRIRDVESELGDERRRIRVNRILAIGAACLASLAIAALVLSIVALNRDIEAIARADPKDGSVTEASIAGGAVTADKLADGAVTPRSLAAGAVGAPAVAGDSLTGAQIAEASLAQVPQAATAQDAKKLGGVAATAFVQGVTQVRVATDQAPSAVKGPILAACPAGTRVIGGGAEVEGSRNVALIESAPTGTTGWTAIAAQQGGGSVSWRLVVHAICAKAAS
jgi:hypothetical protein